MASIPSSQTGTVMGRHPKEQGQTRMGLHVLQELETKRASLSPPKISQNGKSEEKRKRAPGRDSQVFASEMLIS